MSAVAFGTAIADGPPIAFDQFNVTSGSIVSNGDNTNCTGLTLSPQYGTATVTCSDVLVDDGMMQRHVSVYGSGSAELDGDYIQFVVTDSGVTGNGQANPFTAARGNLNFVNEDWVKQNNRGGGIASKQTIIDSSVNGTLEDRFVNTAEYRFGWAQGTVQSDPWVNIEQQLAQVDTSTMTELLSSDFSIANNGPPGNFTDNTKLRIDQRVDLSDSTGNGAQGFVFEKVAGGFQPFSKLNADASSCLLPVFCLSYEFTSPTGTTMLPGGSNGGTLNNFLPGDVLTATWVGQQLPMGGTAADQLFGYTKYASATASTDLTSFSDPQPQNWDNALVFSPTPVLDATPVVVTATDASFYAAPDPLAATIATGSASAINPTPDAIPLSYNDWHVTGGVIDTIGCSGAGVVCGDPTVNEGGVYQRVVSVSGAQYLQTIVTEKTATGDPNTPDFTGSGSTAALAFKNETFVKIKSTNGGIAGNLHVADADLSYVSQPITTQMPSTGGYFTYDTTLKTGDFNGGGTDPRMTVDQRLYAPEDGTPAQVVGVDYDFHLIQGQTQTDKIMYMSDAVGTVTNSTFVDATNRGQLQDPIMFATTRVGGAYLDTAYAGGAPLLPSINGDITWGQYDTVQATWVGGRYTTADPLGFSLVGTTSYTNLSTGDRTSATSITSYPPNPETWFGTFTSGPDYTIAAPVYQQNYAVPAL